MSSRPRSRVPAIAAVVLVLGLLAPGAVAANGGSPPTCSDATFTTREDVAHSGQLACLVDPPSTVALASGPAHGSVAIDPDGSFTYTPDPDYHGADSFTFHATDPDGTGPDATVDITVDPVNDAPSFTKGAGQTVLEDSGPEVVTGWATGLSVGPADESGQALSFVVDSVSPDLFSAGPSVDADGRLTFTPATNANGVATVTLHAQDDGGTANGGRDVSPSQSFTITVTAVNDPPSFAKGSDPIVDENNGPTALVSWATAISRGPADEAGQTVDFVIASNSNPSLFSVQPAIAANGTLTFTPAASAVGAATIGAYLHDNGGVLNGGDATGPTVSFTITVTGINDPPSFTKGANQTDLEDAGPQTVVGWATAISAGPLDESGQALDFVVDTNSNPGLFSAGPAISPTGTLTYTTAANANGSATVTIHLHDSGGIANGGDDTSPSQSFTISVTAVNDPPFFTKGADQTVTEGTGARTVTGWATGIEAGPPNESSQKVDFQVSADVTSLFSVQPAIAANGTLTYTIAPNANGSTAVTVRLHDNGNSSNGGDDLSDAQTFTIAISAINDPPSFTKGTNQSALEDAGPRTILNWATAISPGPPDESGQSVTFVIDSNSNAGLFASGPAISPSGTLTYTSAPDANGSATIVIHLEDDGGIAGGGSDSSPTQSFTITVTPVNDAPGFAKGSSPTALEDAGPQVLIGWASAISSGPADEVAQALSFGIDSNSNAGLFSGQPSVGPTGNLSFTPAANASGVATIVLHVHDSGGTAGGGSDSSATQSFTITVTPVNDPPSFAVGPDQTVPEDVGAQAVAAWTPALSTGPANESGQSLSFVLDSVSNPGLFAVTPAVDGIGALTYTPAADANGSAIITLHARDSGGTSNGGVDESAVRSFTISVTAVNDPPTFSQGPDPIILEDAGPQTIAGWASAPVPGPADESAQVVDYVVDSVSAPALFSVAPSIASDGTLTYTPAPDANGVALVAIHAHDSGGTISGGVNAGAPVTLTITITPVNDAPVCANVKMATSQAAALLSTLTCTDIDSATLHYTKLSDPHLGTAAVADDGSFTYTPQPAVVNQTDSFTFQASDGSRTSSVVTLSISIEPDPTAHNDLATVIQGTGGNPIAVLANDVDRDPGDALRITSVTQGSKGKVTITGGGTGVVYDPIGFLSGTDTFRYTIADSTNRVGQAIVVVTIAKATPRVSPPVATIPVGSTLGSTTTPVRVAWSLRDDGTGVRAYSLQEKRDARGYTTVKLASAGSRSAARVLTLGATWTYRSRLTDTAGNVGAWATAPGFRVLRYQESSGVTYGGTWRTGSSTSYSGGRTRYATAAGASATFRFYGSAVGIVGPRSLTRGTFRVYVDGVYAGAVSERASTSQARRVLFARAFGALGTHTVSIVVAGTAGHPRVDVDAFLVIR